ncbi:methyltransferase domain-containing protein [Terrimicrobium sacchariphilum]|uniref:Methyltransferase domain-containing protein n=1 Tax=Terrimicrobium sacchariphilum TaxID=690879 RepID=A0A146GBF4_TERSA|nr:class I SAM-dependent methyltransferase [Terrimicrobium sacchariphilum]GAT34959.1 methyltransferase domain-containing protein [Terrimicrobium sacchariphilum]
MTILRKLPKKQEERILQFLAGLSIKFANSTHKWLMRCQWERSPQPEHFDHHIDLFHQWLTHRNNLWIERGCFGSLSLKGGKVLELACGDGFNARNFYSLRSQSVIACDFDPAAIETAKNKNSAPNVTFVLADIRTQMPTGSFENIVWDAAIEHFTPDEINALMKAIKARLAPGGILSGYTIVEKSDGKQLSHHEYEFKDKEDLLSFLKPHFEHVTVFETIFPSRHNLYFWASDSQEAIPFDDSWAAMTRK